MNEERPITITLEDDCYSAWWFSDGKILIEETRQFWTECEWGIYMSEKQNIEQATKAVIKAIKK
jgi:hypothetical protein